MISPNFFRTRALIAIEVARLLLAVYAQMTDDPAPGSVEAADLIDAAREWLRGK